MAAMGERFGLPYGLSDHTPDIHTSVAAVALGASQSRSTSRSRKRLYGPDHHASLTPEELARLVDGVRQVEAALGRPEKERDPALDPARATFEKSVVSRARDRRGHPDRAGDADHEAARQRDPGAAASASVVGRRAAARRRRERAARGGRPCLSAGRSASSSPAAPTTRAIKTVLQAIQEHPDLELQIVAGASLVLERFGNAVDVMAMRRLRARRDDPLHHRGRDARRRWRSRPASALLELPTVFELLAARRRRHGRRPLRDDRDRDRRRVHEHPGRAHAGRRGLRARSTRASATPSRSSRTSTSRPPSSRAQRVIAMGEDPATVFNVGCPSIDLVAADRPRARARTRSRTSAAPAPRSIPSEPFVLMMQHPVTTEYGAGPRPDQRRRSRRSRRSACRRSSSGRTSTPAPSRSRRASGCSARRGERHGFHFFRNLPPEIFVRLMAHCACMVGNSSAALREGAFLGTPAVTVGTRQQDRERGENVSRSTTTRTRSPPRSARQIEHGRYERSQLFGDGTRGRADRRDPRRASDRPIQKTLQLEAMTSSSRRSSCLGAARFDRRSERSGRRSCSCGASATSGSSTR